jgi:hypothetical protein
MTGKVPVARAESSRFYPHPTGRMKPSSISGPWQDRRTLISYCDQRPAILRMVLRAGRSCLS